MSIQWVCLLNVYNEISNVENMLKYIWLSIILFNVLRLYGSQEEEKCINKITMENLNTTFLNEKKNSHNFEDWIYELMSDRVGCLLSMVKSLPAHKMLWIIFFFYLGDTLIHKVLFSTTVSIDNNNTRLNFLWWFYWVYQYHHKLLRRKA
jgi:hypothetical protein